MVLGGGGVPTTFPNSAKPSQTFKNDDFQGQLYIKVSGYTWTTPSQTLFKYLPPVWLNKNLCSSGIQKKAWDPRQNLGNMGHLGWVESRGLVSFG